MLKPSTFWADEAKSDLYRCAVKFWKLQPLPNNSGFYQAVCDLYKALARLKTLELEDDSIKDLITKTLTSWNGIEGGERFIDVRDIDFEYFSVIDLIGFDGWRKVTLNEGPDEYREECRALLPGTIRDSELRERFPAVFEFEIFDTKTEWQVKCEVYSMFCELLARQVFGASDKVSTWENKLIELQSGTESTEDRGQPGDEEQHAAPKQGNTKANPLAPDASAFEAFKKRADKSSKRLHEYEWIALSLYFEPTKDEGNQSRETVIESLRKGDNRFNETNTIITVKSLELRIKLTREWHRKLKLPNSDYYEFMRKFLAWKLSPKVTQKVTR